MLLLLLSLSSYLTNESELNHSSDREPSNDKTRYFVKKKISLYLLHSNDQCVNLFFAATEKKPAKI